MKLMPMLLSLISHSFAGNAAYSTAEVRYRTRNVEHIVNAKTMATEETATALSDVFDPFGDSVPQWICYAGYGPELCNLLNAMSDFSKKLYERGDHGIATLKSCSAMDRIGNAHAIVVLEDDYSSEPVQVAVEIAPCGLIKGSHFYR